MNIQQRRRRKGALVLFFLPLLFNSSTLQSGPSVSIVEAFLPSITTSTDPISSSSSCEKYSCGYTTGFTCRDYSFITEDRSTGTSTCSATALYMSSRFNIRNRFFESSKKTPPPPSSQQQQQPKSKPTSSSAVEVEVDELNIDIPRIQVKPRPIVSLDETTGQYIRSTDATTNQDGTTINKSNSNNSNSKSNTSSSYSDDSYPQVSGWAYFKDFVYDAIDFVSKAAGTQGTTSTNTSASTSGNRNAATTSTTSTASSSSSSSPLSSMKNRNLAVAYSDTVEFKTKNSNNLNTNPLNMLTKQKQQQSTSSSTIVAQQYESSLSSSNKDRSDGEDLFRSDFRKSFDAAKDGIYDLFMGGKKAVGAKDGVNVDVDADTVSTVSASEKLQSKSPLLQKIESSSSSSSSSSFEQDSTTFKPLSKPSTNQDETITSITPYLADLDSPNPIKSLSAKYAIASIERKNKRRLQQQAQREAIEETKRRIYDAVDAVQNLYGAVVDVPRKVEQAAIAAEMVVGETVQSTKDTVREVKTIPSKVQKAVEDTVRSVEETKQVAVGVVEEVRSIPTKVENKVAETKQSIQETREGVEKVVKKVEDLMFEAKVLAGLEKPKPLPPPPPPPPKTNQEIALDVAGVVAKTTGKAAVVVGKGTISLTATAAKAAFNAAKEQSQKQKLEQKDGKENASLLSRFTSTVDSGKKKDEAAVKPVAATDAVEAISSSSVVAEAIETPITIGQIDPLLELEVADALKSAEDALISAKKEKNNPKTTQTTLEINLALEQARVAAAKARKDAEDLELMLEKRREMFFKP